MNQNHDVSSQPCRVDAMVPSRGRDTVSSTNESYRISVREFETNALRKAMARRGERFLKGPVLMRDIGLANGLPGQALALLLAVHHQTALTGKVMVTLPGGLLRTLGVSKDAKSRGLHELERAGLVRVERTRGRSARVGLAVRDPAGGPLLNGKA